MKNISLIIKGFLIGVGKIIPGVSGSLLAITMGIYGKLMNSIGNFFCNIKENIKFLMPVLIGVSMAIILMSKLIFSMLDKYYVITMLFFIGLIAGGIPSLIKKVKKYNFKNIVLFILSFSLIFSLSFIDNNKSFGVNNYPLYIFFLLGLLDAATMIIPGISGSAIMILLGCYGTVLDLFSNVYEINNIIKILPFLIGVVIGTYLISKFVAYSLKKFYHESFSCILGFLLSSCFLLIINVLKCNTNLLSIFIGIFLFVIGIFVSLLLEK